MTQLTPCPKCDFKYANGFHICIPPDAPEPEVFKKAIRAYNKGVPYNPTDERRAAWSAAQQDRWAKIKLENAERDKEVAHLYSEQHWSMLKLSEKFGIGRGTIQKILNEHSVEIRPRGKNNRHTTV